MFERLIVLTALVNPVVALAVTPEECVVSYSNQSRMMDKKADRLQFGARGLKYGGTSYGTSHGSTSGGGDDDRDSDVSSTTGKRGMSTSAVLGGSSLGSTADGYTADAQFSANVAQSIAESRAQVAGPTTTQLASDLNAAIYNWSRPETFSSSLGRSTKAKLRTALEDRRVTAAEVAAATNQLVATGDLCDEEGRPLTQDAWAILLVGRITGQELRR